MVLAINLSGGSGAPLASLIWDVACLDMGVRVLKQKVLLVLHLRFMDKESLTHRVFMSS